MAHRTPAALAGCPALGEWHVEQSAPALGCVKAQVWPGAVWHVSQSERAGCFAPDGVWHEEHAEPAAGCVNTKAAPGAWQVAQSLRAGCGRSAPVVSATPLAMALTEVVSAATVVASEAPAAAGAVPPMVSGARWHAEQPVAAMS